ncbi:LuxR C-terminal-related transcriptional regulator [Pseudonocardia xinjiangensis]|uniref:response regulator transcription factor n=1 Tax=Pseudonocardia xinjiangensis TaxID=75289 RepID=UPI003D91227D
MHDNDPLSRAGVVALLRNQSDMLVAEDPAGTNGDCTASVAIIIIDLLDEATLHHLRKLVVDRNKKVVLVTGELDDAQIKLLVDTEVQNFVWRRSATAEELVKAVQIASLGEGVVPPDLLPALLTQLRRARHDDGRELSARTALTEREVAVLRLAAEGLDTKEIAVRLSYSERTVKGLLHDLMVRMQMRNRTQAVAFAVREGYI